MLTRNDFLIDDTVVFLNHGSFGACSKPVFAKYQQYQLELERQPIEFLGRRSDAMLNDARQVLADYLNAPVEELIFVPNATLGLNVVARSMVLNAGDEILTTNHEYGALNKTWQFMCQQTGAEIVRYTVDLPYTSDDAFVEGFFQKVTPRTKVIFLSHITSPTALIFPVDKICARARELGILTMIDGAHVPGQIPLDLTTIGADVYSGNCHKWLCSPKGSAFLHVRKDYHPKVHPLVISHGWYEGADFIMQNQWQGTRDIAPFLSVPDAIQFQQEHDWEEVRATCHQLALNTQARLCDDFGLQPISENQFAQMVAIPLPECDVADVKSRLYDEFRVEVPVHEYEGKPYVRVSYQAYNSADDAQALINALHKILD